MCQKQGINKLMAQQKVLLSELSVSGPSPFHPREESTGQQELTLSG